MTEFEFAFVRDLVARRSGLALAASKRYLVETRLEPLARRRGHPTISALLAAARAAPRSDLETEIVEAMATHETSFLRDGRPLQLAVDVLAEAAQRAGGRPLQVWSAACSTGQEPYSLLMMLEAARARIGAVNCNVLATDLSNAALTKAKAGIYSQFEVQRGLPIEMLLKHFTQIGRNWQISAAMRSRVDFRSLNLIESWPNLPRFDLILVRNVLIYFEPALKLEVLRRLRERLEPNGALILGAAETVIGLDCGLEPDPKTPGLYRLAAPRLRATG